MAKPKAHQIFGPLVYRLVCRPVTPKRRVRFSYGPPNDWCVAQLVELLAVNQAVTGSSPVTPANLWRGNRTIRRLAQSGSALALGARGRRFESYISDQICRYSLVGRAGHL